VVDQPQNGLIMKYIEAPQNYRKGPSETALFLAGGITDCPDWQREVVYSLGHIALTLYNPRRAHFPIDEPDVAEGQIKWEHYMLRDADAILFWFPCETLNPIVLYELGAWSMTSKPIFVGVHPDYQRRQDVEIQTGLARPDVSVAHSLDELIERVESFDWSSIRKPE
jgi:nucleoside 2-deoxyribosyltransferase-like protein